MGVSDNPGQRRFPIRGTTGLVVAVLLVVLVCIWVPAYRLFLLLSMLIGVVIAGGLMLWHKYRPLKEKDVHNKRPLGLE
jgi:hypothetical protein